MKRIIILITIALLLMGCSGESDMAENTKDRGDEMTEKQENIKTDFEEPLALWIWQNEEGSQEDTIVVRFYSDLAPNHVENFIKLSQNGFYSGNKIFRVVPDFVIQTGSPTDEPTGGPGYTIDEEFNPTKHIMGTLAMARAQDPNSAGSQYYFALKALPNLDNNYTVFGQAIENAELLDNIKKGDYVKEVKIVEASEYYGENCSEKIEQLDPHNN